MNASKFNSVMAPYIKGLLDQKRALGYKYDVEEYVLGCFDKYWVQSNGKVDTITEETLSDWMKQRETEGKSSQAMRISIVRQLALYMNGQGKDAYIPECRIRCPHPVAYVLTPSEINAFLSAVDAFAPRRQSPAVTRMADGYRVIFRLYLTTGLRRNEAVGIRIRDINWSNNSITIYNAKGHKDRIVFMSSDVSALLSEYIAHNQSVMATEWAFPSANPSRHFSGDALSLRFRKFWNETPFASDTAKQPTIHSLRHTYVVFRMNAWMSQGVDLNVMLPYLSRMLGHKSSNETFYYYHQVLQAYKLIQAKDSLATTVFPEVRAR